MTEGRQLGVEARAMKMDEQNFGRRYLLVCLGTALGICAAVEVVCLLFGVAPLFTPNLAFNEKLRFIRDHRPGPTPVGVISGASIALNDVDTDLLQQEEGLPFINLGANALSVQSAQHFYNQFRDTFPVREVIFATQPLEMRDGLRASVEVKNDLFHRYVSGKMTIPEEFTYRDISGMLTYWQSWSDYHSRSAHTSLVFSKTGAVPLEISRDNAEPKLWNGDTMVVDLTCTHCTDDLEGFCRQVRGEDRNFTVILAPLRPGMIEHRSDIRALDVDRRARIRSVVEDCGGALFDANQYAAFDDACFADSAHLNARGMHAITDLLVQFRRGDLSGKSLPLSCSPNAVASR